MVQQHAYGEGSISFHKATGKYMGQANVAGRRITVYGQTEKDVRRKLSERRQQAVREGGIAKGETLAQLAEYWLEQGDWKPKTRHGYQQQTAYLLQLLGPTTRLARLTPATIEIALRKYRDRTRTQQLLHMRLNQIFKTGVRIGWVPANPISKVNRPKHTTKRKTIWSADQTARFLALAGRWSPLWLTAIATGARIGELRALRWCDVDLEAGTVRFERALSSVGSKDIVGTPKTNAGVRTVTLPPQAVTALKDHQEQQWADLDQLNVSNPEGWIWLNDEGKLPTYYCIRMAFDRDARRAGLKGSTHLLRHISASALIAGGMPIPNVARRLGHASSAITMSVYAHAINAYDQGGEIVAGFLPSQPARLPSP